MGGLLSQNPSDGERGKPYLHDGVQYGPKGLERRQWSVSREGLDHLARQGRLWANTKDGEKEVSASKLRVKIYRHEMPGRRITNLWDRTIAASDKRYPVQTGNLAIERCILMTTKPGDLVLDPTNGSGTTATVAEIWGRRWIAIDSSRESLAVTRERVLMHNYPSHLLIGSDEGFNKEQELRRLVGQEELKEKPKGGAYDPATGIVLKRQPYVSAASMAYENVADRNNFRDVTIFTDRPEGKKTGRICGRFTVETEYASELVSPDEIRRPMQQKRDADWEERVKAALLTGGFQTESGKRRFSIDDLESLVDDTEGKRVVDVSVAGLRWSAEIRDIKSGKKFDAIIAVQPHDTKVGCAVLQQMVRTVIQNYTTFSTLVVIGIEFGPGTENRFAVDVIRLNASADLHLKGVQDKSTNSAARLFVVAELATEIELAEDNNHTVTLHGMMEFNPISQQPTFTNNKSIRLWMIDTDYDGLQFRACRIHLTESTRESDNRKLLHEILRSDADNEGINTVFGFKSRPFPKPKNGQIAVRAILAGGGVATSVVNI